MALHYSQHIALLILGILGNLATTAFLLSSLPTFVKIIQRKSLGGLSCDLYAFKLFNCLLWTVYGLPIVHPHNFWVLFTNSIGCLLSLLYISSYIYAATAKERWSIIWKLVILSTLFTSIMLVLLLVEHTRKVRIMVIGILCATISSCMHLTLLSQLRMTLCTKRAKYMYPKASTTAFMKSAIWTAYGVVNNDLYIIIPNMVGIATALVQLLVAAYLVVEAQKQGSEGVSTHFLKEQSTQKEGAAEGEAAIAIAMANCCTRKEDLELQAMNLARFLSNLQIQTRGVVVPIDELTRCTDDRYRRKSCTS